MVLISSIVEAVLDSVRPGSRSSAGFPCARQTAVCAPMPSSLGPVITTTTVSDCARR